MGIFSRIMWNAKNLTVDVYFFPIYIHQKKSFLATKQTYPQKKSIFTKANSFEKIFRRTFYTLSIPLYILF